MSLVRRVTAKWFSINIILDVYVFFNFGTAFLQDWAAHDSIHHS